MSSLDYRSVWYNFMKFTCNGTDTISKTVRCACANTQQHTHTHTHTHTVITCTVITEKHRHM